MIGGAPFFMGILEDMLTRHGFSPMYAFSKRVVLETKNDDGTVTKTSDFKYEGFVASVPVRFLL